MPLDPDNALVQAWDRAQQLPAWQRPAALAAALAPSGAAPPSEEAPVGVVARRALEVASAWFGAELEGVFTCRACGEPMEASLSAAELLAGAPAEDPGPFPVDTGDSTLLVRLPRPSDVAAAGDADSQSEGVRALLERIVLEGPSELDVVGAADAVAAACEARDPLGAVAVEVVCPACGERDTAALDIAGWCWAMADAHARRLLDEVHLLASAYGWSEQEILALGPRRRAVYVDWVA